MFGKNLRKQKAFRFLTAAVMAGTLTFGQWNMALAVDVDQTITEEEEKNILDVVIIEKIVPLEEIKLPECIYGKLLWKDSSYVMQKEQEDCEVILIPDKDVDVSWMKGWDPITETVNAYLTVAVGEIKTETTEKESTTETTTEEQISETVEETTEEMAEEVAEETTEELTEETSEISIEETESIEAAEEEKTEDETETEDDLIIAEETSEDSEEFEEIEIEDDLENIGGEIEEVPAEGTEKEDQEEEIQDDKTEDPEETLPPVKEPEEEIKQPETIFDRKEIQEDIRPMRADDSISADAKRSAAFENHTCEGIVVTGTDLPWYVQFRVYDGGEYQFSNQEGADLFKAYEFKLWDTLNDVEYEIPDGSYVTVRMEVPKGYEYTVEHILPSGAKESIYPMLNDTTLVFSTHSFSPFGIAGSTILIGGNIPEHNYQDPTPTPKPTATPIPTKAPDKEPTKVPTKAPEKTPTKAPTKTPTKAPEKETNGSAGNSDGNKNGNSSGNTGSYNGSGQNASSGNNGSNGQNSQNGIPNTGDNSMIGLYAGIAGAALLLIILAVVLLLKKRK